MRATHSPHYHHGNLKQALLKAGLQMIKNGQTISIRGLAKAVEVTPAAVYRHFESKEMLLATLAQEGFKKMQQRFQAIESQTPKEHLFKLGEAYVEFALEHPEHFQIMFGAFDWHSHQFESLNETSDDTFLELANVCQTLAPDAPNWLITATWSQVHGYATLALIHRGQSCEHSGFVFQETSIRTVIENTWSNHFTH